MASVKTSIKTIIDSITLNALDPDHFLSNTKRWYIKKIATKGVVEFTEKFTGTAASLRITVGDNNQISLPADFIKTLGLYELHIPSGRLQPIGEDSSITTANSYLLDNNGLILLDDDNVELVGSGDTDIDRESTQFDYNTCGRFLDNQFFYGGWGSYYHYCQYYNINHSFVRDIHYRNDFDNGIIQLAGRKLETVVLEYSVDPLKNVGSVDDLEIDEYFGDALEKYIYKEILAPRRSVGITEKEISKRDFKEALLEARINKLVPTINSIASATNLR